MAMLMAYGCGLKKDGVAQLMEPSDVKLTVTESVPITMLSSASSSLL